MAFNIAQIVAITSENLQRKIRDLLPSQQGFGVDLQASNVIVPIVDLTATAEGSGLPENMQQSLAFGSQTSVVANNSTATLANTAGFYRIFGGVSLIAGGVLNTVDFDMSDGVSTKEILSFTSVGTTTSTLLQSFPVDFVVFLRSGDSCSVTAQQFAEFSGSVRQIADVNGNLVNPVGYNPQ